MVQILVKNMKIEDIIAEDAKGHTPASIAKDGRIAELLDTLAPKGSMGSSSLTPTSRSRRREIKSDTFAFGRRSSKPPEVSREIMAIIQQEEDLVSSQDLPVGVASNLTSSPSHQRAPSDPNNQFVLDMPSFNRSASPDIRAPVIQIESVPFDTMFAASRMPLGGSQSFDVLPPSSPKMGHDSPSDDVSLVDILKSIGRENQWNEEQLRMCWTKLKQNFAHRVGDVKDWSEDEWKSTGLPIVCEMKLKDKIRWHHVGGARVFDNTPIGDLLHVVGREHGWSEEEKKHLARILHLNFAKTVRHLRILSPSDWQRMQLPIVAENLLRRKVKENV
eukprot:TRINITY_DN475_c0_g1_i2.p1 TRINITY_DN475_c0_g1~~TRINITY_DN475_c0_g1_i2.p1  ORF type:complete len:332 (+),score=87.48 TRINITY_DN475_c0_g1_i2:449-1444(+)